MPSGWSRQQGQQREQKTMNRRQCPATSSASGQLVRGV
jgi:hypothetical protein